MTSREGKRIVYFAATMAAARRAAAGRAEDASFASPASPSALNAALRAPASVVVVEPPRATPAWEEAKRRFLLPPAPVLLREAILGIATDQESDGPSAPGGPSRAHWIPGALTERRAAALVSSPPVPLLWIVEDFRSVRLSPETLRSIRRRGVRIAAFRALRVLRRPARPR